MKKFLFISLVFMFFSFHYSCNNRGLLDAKEETTNDSVSVFQDSNNLITTKSVWHTDQFVDEFGDKESDYFIFSEDEGTFSNSATNNAYLYVKIIFKKDAAGIFLHEYSSDRPPECFPGLGKILLKNFDGIELTVYSYSKWSQSGGLLIADEEYNKLKDFVYSSEGHVKFVVFDEYSSSFKFNINASGFKAEYDSLIRKHS